MESPIARSRDLNRPFRIRKGVNLKRNIGARHGKRKVIIRRPIKRKACFFEQHSKTSAEKIIGLSVKPEIAQNGCNANRVTELQFDVISEEILVLLPVRSLMRLKCVAKQWCSLIESDYFIKKHMNRSTPVLVRDCDELGISGIPRPSYFNVKGFRGYEIIGVFDGLVIYRIWDKYFVNNPATLQRLTLPDPLGHSHQMWFDLNPCSGEPKLLCEYQVKHGDFVVEKGYQILTVGKDEHWRNLTPPRGEELLMVSGDKDMYFLRLIQTGRAIELQVSAFDIRGESFTAIDFPRGFFPEMSRVFPFWWNESLAIGDFNDEELRVVVLEKRSRTYQWSVQKEVVVPLSFLAEKTCAKEKLVPVSAESKELWFHYGGVCKLCYDMETGRVKERGLLANEKREAAIFEYRPSLKSLKGMRPEC